MEVSRKPLMGFLMDPFARGVRGLMLSSTGISVEGPDQRIVSFQDLSAPPSVTRGLLSSTIILNPSNDGPVILKALGWQAAIAFGDATTTAWRAFAVSELDARAPEIDHLLAVMARLADPSASSQCASG